MSEMDLLGSVLIIIFIVLVLKLLNEWWEYDDNKNNTSDISNNLVSNLHLWRDKRKKRGRNKRWLEKTMKPQLIYTNDNGDEFAITPLRNNYMLTIGKDKRYQSTVVPVRTLLDMLIRITQELADGVPAAQENNNTYTPCN